MFLLFLSQLTAAHVLFLWVIFISFSSSVRSEEKWGTEGKCVAWPPLPRGVIFHWDTLTSSPGRSSKNFSPLDFLVVDQLPRRVSTSSWGWCHRCLWWPHSIRWKERNCYFMTLLYHCDVLKGQEFVCDFIPVKLKKEQIIIKYKCKYIYNTEAYSYISVSPLKYINNVYVMLTGYICDLCTRVLLTSDWLIKSPGRTRTCY